MTETWPRSGRCGACARPAHAFPSGRWEHQGRPCVLRSQTLFRALDVNVRDLLVFVPDGAELPQTRTETTAARAQLVERYPHVDWTAHFARPTTYDRVRAQLAAEADGLVPA